MTVQELLGKLQQMDVKILVGIFIGPPVISWFISILHGKSDGNESPWKYLYSFLVYVVCVPGIFSCIITGYSLFFIRQNLMTVNMVLYFLPIISMIITLIIIGKNAEWTELPGVDRLYALMIFIGVSFIIALAVEKTRIWVFFGGSIHSLILIALFCFALLKYSSYMIFRRSHESKRKLRDYTDYHKFYEKELKQLRKNLRKK